MKDVSAASRLLKPYDADGPNIGASRPALRMYPKLHETCFWYVGGIHDRCPMKRSPSFGLANLIPWDQPGTAKASTSRSTQSTRRKWNFACCSIFHLDFAARTKRRSVVLGGRSQRKYRVGSFSSSGHCTSSQTSLCGDSPSTNPCEGCTRTATNRDSNQPLDPSRQRIFFHPLA